MKISTLKSFMNEAAKKYGIKDANIKLNKHGMVIEMASNNHLQFAHQFSEAVKSKLVVEGFAFKEIKDDSDFDKIVKNYLFKNANITTNRDNEQIIIPTDDYGYGVDNGEEYFDTDYQNSIDNMTDDEYQDYVLFHDVNTLPYSDVEFLPDDENSTITFSATCCDIPDECYGDECYSGNLFDRISTDYDTDVDYNMSVDDMIDKDYEENDDYETDLSKVSRSAKRIVDFGTDDTDLDEEEIDEKRNDILLGKMQESFKYMPTDKKRLIKEDLNRDIEDIKYSGSDVFVQIYTTIKNLNEFMKKKHFYIVKIKEWERDKKPNNFIIASDSTNEDDVISDWIDAIAKGIKTGLYSMSPIDDDELSVKKGTPNKPDSVYFGKKYSKYNLNKKFVKGIEEIKDKEDIDTIFNIAKKEWGDDSESELKESIRRKLRRKLNEMKRIESQFGKKLRNRKFSK